MRQDMFKVSGRPPVRLSRCLPFRLISNTPHACLSTVFLSVYISHLTVMYCIAACLYITAFVRLLLAFTCQLASCQLAAYRIPVYFSFSWHPNILSSYLFWISGFLFVLSMLSVYCTFQHPIYLLLCLLSLFICQLTILTSFFYLPLLSVFLPAHLSDFLAVYILCVSWPFYTVKKG
jgi:hypothetical protein